MAKILLIEDDPLIQKTVELKFKKEGFDVVCASDGKEGLEKLATENPDIVLTDLMLPYSSGLEIVTAVKAMEGRNIHVIVFSSMGQEHVVEEAFELGADDYITKPFSLTELTIRIKKQLKR
ncbi:MAG: response regulator transcription factor [Bacteroidota bacterium]